MSMKPEPGSSMGPVAGKTLSQTRNVRDLNTRLQVFVQTNNQRRNEIRRLKEENARQEMELKAKIQQQRDGYTSTIEKMRSEIENLTFEHQKANQDLSQLQSAKQHAEDRLIAAESKKAELSSLCDNLQTENDRHKAELDQMRKSYASLKYKYESFEIERKSFGEKCKKSTKLNENLLRKLAKVEAELKSEKTTIGQVLVEKNEEIDNQRTQIQKLQTQNEAIRARLRKEFDDKLGVYVQKREDQYRLEKEEWMRIFKDEYNRKISSFKSANEEMAADNKKKEGELTDLRTRISKLRQQKTELEVQHRNTEEEVEKLRNDLDDLRRTKDDEIQSKNKELHGLNDQYTAKCIEFDELAGIKVQLDAEIELYRSILNEAEEACGYMSPLDARNRNGSAARNSRKRRRIANMTPMGPLREKMETTGNTKRGHKVVTPGVERAAKNAQKDAMKAFESADEEMKDEEEEDCFDVDCGQYVTPGNVEGATLQFSGLDLNKGMIEIQNCGENEIDLNGYCLSNAQGTAQYELPKNMKLERLGKLRIYVGKTMYDQMKNDELDREEIVGDYTGTYVFWGRDVWTGNDKDCARLYNPQQSQVAIMEISPEMVDIESAKNGCCVM